MICYNLNSPAETMTSLIAWRVSHLQNQRSASTTRPKKKKFRDEDYEESQTRREEQVIPLEDRWLRRLRLTFAFGQKLSGYKIIA